MRARTLASLAGAGLLLTGSTFFAASASSGISAAAGAKTDISAASPAPAAASPAPLSTRRARMASAAVAAGLPLDMTSPEGRTRWDLSNLPTLAFAIVEAREYAAGAPAVVTDTGASSVVVRRLGDPTGGDAATGWLFPDRDRDALRLGERRTFELEEGEGAVRDRLHIEVETVGVGWVHLASGPREVALQRALVLRRAAAGHAFEPDLVIHRWVDPLAGIVAEIAGPASSDGRTRTSVSRAQVLQELLTPAAVLKLHVSEVDTPVLGGINYGWDRGPNTPVSSLTPAAPANLAALIAPTSWDFSGTTIASTTLMTGTTTANNTTAISGTGTAFTAQLAVGDRISLSSAPGTFALVTAVGSNTSATVNAPLGNGTSQTINRRVREAASTTTPINASETCNTASCAYNTPGGQLDRRDLRFDVAGGLRKNNTISQLETRASDAVIWLRAGSQNEGVAGAFGQGESRFCYSPFDDNGDGTIQAAENRSLVPEWQFTHNDGDGKGYYFQAGDSAFGGPFNCQQNLYNEVCGGGGFASHLYAKPCTGSDGQPHTGKQSVDIIKNGVITLPSGHTFNALLARNLTDFCVYLDSGCGFKVDEVRTVNYLWQVPRLGTLVRVQGPQNAAFNYDTTAMLVETDIEFGLFPPRTITAPSSTNTTVSLSWDPGLDTRRITGYKVYWDTDSGGTTAYAFNSIANAGQASIVGTTATISGLTAGTNYFFTVTSRSAYTDPSSGVVTTYESLVYPSQVFGDPSFVYPIEVQKATTGGACIPTAQVQNLTVTRSGATDVQICWSPVSDPCLIGYRVLAASSPTSDVNFSTLGDVGLTTCFTGPPGAGPLRYFLVVARGTGGTGPWGAYGH